MLWGLKIVFIIRVIVLVTTIIFLIFWWKNTCEKISFVHGIFNFTFWIAKIIDFVITTNMKDLDVLHMNIDRWFLGYMCIHMYGCR